MKVLEQAITMRQAVMRTVQGYVVRTISDQRIRSSKGQRFGLLAFSH